MRMTNNNQRFIIDESSKVSSKHKLTAVGITLLFWAALLYLWQPIISLFAWWLNIRLFYNHMILLGGYQAFLEIVVFYITVVSILGGGLILWGLLNQLRYRKKNVRIQSITSDNPQIAHFFKIRPAILTHCKSSKNLKIKLDELGKIINVNAQSK